MAKQSTNRGTCNNCGKPCQPAEVSCSAACYHALNRIRVAKYSSQRHKAYIAIQSALKKGLVVRQPCEVCGAEKAQAHHDDYAKPLDVRWLCGSHHRQHHVKFGAGKNAFKAEKAA